MKEATMPFGSTTMGFVRSLEQKILEFIVNYIIGKVLDISVKVVEPTLRALIKKLNVRFPLGVGTVTFSILQVLGYLPYTGWLNNSLIIREIWSFVAATGGIFAILDGIKWRGISYRGVQLIGPSSRFFGGAFSRQSPSHSRATPKGTR